jgi:transcription initiation factor TFIID TATA-box-binding protein
VNADASGTVRIRAFPEMLIMGCYVAKIPAIQASDIFHEAPKEFFLYIPIIVLESRDGGGLLVDITVVNIVASASVGVELDLREISDKLDEINYDPGKFPGAICRVKTPKAAILFFHSGKLVCTGARSLEDVHTVIDMMMKKLRDMKVMVDESPEITVQNMVATVDLGARLKLDSIAITLGLENVEFEPEQFPGLVYRVRDPKVVMLLFSSGKVVCTGAKKIDDIKRAVSIIIEDLKGANFL